MRALRPHLSLLLSPLFFFPLGSNLHHPNTSLGKLAHPGACTLARTQEQNRWASAHTGGAWGSPVAHAHASTHTQLRRGRQGPLPTHICSVNEPLSGTGGSECFCEDKLGLACLHFGLCSHFSGNSWAEFRVDAG